jgi:murein peptide amidase A
MHQGTSSLLATLLVALASIACRSGPDRSEPPSHTPVRAEVSWVVGGESVEGRRIEYAVFGSGEDTVLMVAGIHGNEEAGTPLLVHLAELAVQLPTPSWLEGRRLVILPWANPDGLAVGRRRNARNVDLNRNFPSKNFRAQHSGGTTPLSEPESRLIHQLFEFYEPDRILSFHMPVDVIDYDGPAEGLVRAMGEVSPLPVRRIGSRPGSLGSWAGLDLGLPIVTVELPASARELELEKAWGLYGPMILAAIEYEG